MELSLIIHLLAAIMIAVSKEMEKPQNKMKR